MVCGDDVMRHGEMSDVMMVMSACTHCYKYAIALFPVSPLQFLHRLQYEAKYAVQCMRLLASV